MTTYEYQYKSQGATDKLFGYSFDISPDGQWMVVAGKEEYWDAANFTIRIK